MSQPPDPLAPARLALDRAHAAARAASGAELRRSIEEAAELLRASRPECAALLRTALEDLGSGALADLDLLLERVRREVGPTPD